MNGSSRWGNVFYALGVCFVVLGGLVAAVTGPLDLTKGSWLAAYLVLVCGVAQCVIGRAQVVLAREPVPPRVWMTQLHCWNTGNLLVVVGSLTSSPYVVDVGGLLLLPTLALGVWATRDGSGPWLWPYRAVLLLLAVTMPVGLVLAHLRA